MYIGSTGSRRSPPPHLGGRRQRGRRGDGRLLHSHRRHAARRRRLPRRRRRSRHSRRPVPHRARTRARARPRSCSPCCMPAASSAATATRCPADSTVSVSASSTRSARSSSCEVDRDGQRYEQLYADGGRPQDKMAVVGPTPSRGRTSGHVDHVLAGRHHLPRRGHRVRRPHRARALADDGVPQQGPRDRVHRSARGSRADGHVSVQGRHRRLRQAPQRVEGATVLQGRVLRRRRRRRWPDARHRAAVEHRLLRRHPRLRQRHLHHRRRHARRGLQDRAHQRRQQVRASEEPHQGEGRQPAR